MIFIHMEIIRWKINPELKKEIDSHYRTKMAISLKDKPVIDIVREITFDGAVPNITINDSVKLIDYIKNNFLPNYIKGVGLEVGGGCGFFGSILINNEEVNNFYSVEVCENIVNYLMTKVVYEISGKEKSNKIVGCIGEFNNIELPNNSVDFIFDFFSLHHSDNISITFQELYRVLKPGGVVVCLDKARSNKLSSNDLERLLDTEYSPESKKIMGISPERFFTRRMNGEKEYRLNDWKKAFLSVGFKRFKHYHISRVVGGRFSYKIKLLFSHFSVFIQSIISNIFNVHSGNKNNLEIKNRVYTSIINPFPKEISLMIAYK